MAQNGRDNYGTNYYCTSGIATNASGSYRIVTHASTNGAAGDGFEYNVNVAAAWFPYAEYLGGFVRNDAGTNSGVLESVHRLARPGVGHPRRVARGRPGSGGPDQPGD